MKANKIQEDDFYKEMDQRTFKKSCCSFQAMAILFGVVLVLASIAAFYLAKQIKQISISSRVVLPTLKAQNSFFDKIEGLDNQKNSEFSLVVTSEELTSLLNQGFTTNRLLVKEIQAIVTSDGIVISGKLTEPLESDLIVETKPYIEEGKVKLEIIKITAGKLAIPKFLHADIEKSLNGQFDEKFSNLYSNYQVENIETNTDQIIISGRRK